MSNKESLPTIAVPEFPGKIFDSTGNFEVNRMITFQTESPEEVSIHVNEIFNEEGQKENIGEKLRLLRDALKIFAELLEKHESLKEIETISAFSWIVTEHPTFMEQFGFTLSSPPDYFRRLRRYYEKDRIGGMKSGKILKKPSFASMTREKFLELYGSK